MRPRSFASITAAALLLAATARSEGDAVPQPTTVSLRAGGPVPLDAVVIGIPDALGPRGPTCRQALGLDALPPEDATAEPPEEPETADAGDETAPEEPADASTGADDEAPPTPQEPEAASPTPSPAITLDQASVDVGALRGRDPRTLPPQPLEGPAEVLRPIREVWRRGDRGEPLRLSFFGASHTGGDWWTGRIRRVLQDRWGDRGHGFVLPAALYPGYRASDVNLCRTAGWESDWVGKRRGRHDGLLGFAGMSVTSSDPQDFGWVETTVTNPHGRSVSAFDVYTLGQPEGGTLTYVVDDAEPGTLSTKAIEPMLQRTRLLVADGPHRLALGPAGDGEVRLFGVSMERDGPGVIVDAMGIRGRQARTWLDWNWDLAGQGIATLDPDLVVLAYGTNEAANTRYDMDAYRKDLHAVLDRVRSAVPWSTACILVGPSDRVKDRGRGRYQVWERTAEVAQVQREVAPLHGCAFWDWQAAMGGPGSMLTWRMQDPPLAARDLIHHSKDGYELVADRFLVALDALALDPRLQ